MSASVHAKTSPSFYIPTVLCVEQVEAHEHLLHAYVCRDDGSSMVAMRINAMELVNLAALLNIPIMIDAACVNSSTIRMIKKLAAVSEERHITVVVQ